MKPQPADPTIAQIRERLDAGHAALRRDYEARSSSSHFLAGRTALVDASLQALWAHHALPADLALVAVGGYGRGELFPSSDIDLMVLLPAEPGHALEQALTTFVSDLWDIGLEVGVSVRTLTDCLEQGAADVTVQTTLLEARLLDGCPTLFDRFQHEFRQQLDIRSFFKAKTLEQQHRHARYDDTPYALEPNCKESPGGLRDLQMLGWIARAAGLARNWRDLARKRLLTGAEASELRSIERFLQHIRIRLHHLCGRAEDRLLFDHQENLARAMGIDATSGKRASEVLMQRFYLTAKKLTQINTILLQNYAAVIFPDTSSDVPEVLNERFQITRELLDVRHDRVFEKHPSALLECFTILQQRADLKGMSARALRLLWLNRKRINAAFRAEPHNRALFMQILHTPRSLVRELRRMNQYGILGRYLPAWRRIVCQMQHDLFHVYTVDQHILMVVRNLHQFTLGKHAHEYPLMTKLMLGFERHWVLYVAALFHDIAKGRGGDHSLLGMDDARQFCEQHDIPADDTALIVWLVEHHLTLSRVAQKQDTSDPAVIQEFAELVGDERRLTALYLLTHADIRGTSPKVWNGWRGKLLEDLFFATRRRLQGATPRQALGLDERQAQARALLRLHGLEEEVEDTFWAQLDPAYFMRTDADDIAWHTRLLHDRPANAQSVVKARVTPSADGLEVMVYTPDANDLFARLTGFFGKRGLSILDAKIHTTRHGYALDTFILQDPAQEADYRSLATLIEHDLSAHLDVDSPPEHPGEVRLSRHVQHFPITPSVHIRADETGQHFILTISSVDRPGLLFHIAQLFARHNITVHTAKITTLGERIEDTFLLSGAALQHERLALQMQRELLDLLQV